MTDTAMKYVELDPCMPFAKEKVQVSLCNDGKLIDISIYLMNINTTNFDLCNLTTTPK